MADDLFELIREHVSIFDILQEFAPESYAAVRTQDVGHKIPCPLAASRHGEAKDTNPSSKFFPETNSLYCWSCHGSWDPISLYAELNEMFKLDDQGRTLTDTRGGRQLDYGRAALELAKRKGLEFKSPDWYKRLKKSVAALSDVSRNTLPVEQWQKLDAFYTEKLITWAYGRINPDTKEVTVEAAIGREAAGDMLDTVLDYKPDFGIPHVERELHTWFTWAKNMLLWQARRHAEVQAYAADRMSAHGS